MLNSLVRRASQSAQHITFLVFAVMMCSVGVSRHAVAGTSSKVALVIGNSSYLVHPLVNPSNDASLIGGVLTHVGFDVIQETDLTADGMNRAIARFQEKSRNAAVALVFYAGHGVQINGRNYLLPVDLVPKSEADIRYGSIELTRMIEQLGDVRERINIVIVDACRNNPYAPKLDFIQSSRVAERIHQAVK